jgi:hypothetical protein
MRSRARLAIVVVLTVLSVFLTTGTVFAGSSESVPPPDSLEITGYTITKRGVDGAFTGSILKGDVVTVEVSFLDTRIKNGVVTPVAAINTASFSLWNSSDIKLPGQVAAGTGGCSYTIRFENTVYTGTGTSFAFDISYAGTAYPSVLKDIPFNKAVPSEKETTDPAKPSTDKTTGFVLKDARYGDGSIYAGQAFVLSASILATNGVSAVENVSVSFAPPEQLTLSDGSSVVYVGTMAPGASAPVSLTLLPNANITEGSYTVSIKVNGVNQKTGEAVTADMTVSIPILQPERFEIFNTKLPTDLTAGMDDGMGFGSITLVNRGKGAVSNVSVEVIGNGLSTDEGRQYIGNVNGGEQKTADFNIQAAEPGSVDALVVVSYENVRGEQKTLEQAFQVNVMEGMDPGMVDPGMIDPGMDPGMEGEGAGGIKPWMWIVIGAAAAAAVSIVLLRRRKKRLAAAEAALDYTDDDED